MHVGVSGQNEPTDRAVNSLPGNIKTFKLKILDGLTLFVKLRKNTRSIRPPTSTGTRPDFKAWIFE